MTAIRQSFALALLLAAFVLPSRADVYIVNGERVEGEVHEVGGQKTLCTDTVCIMLPPDAVKVEDGAAESAPAPAAAAEDEPVPSVRMALGFMKPDEFLAFLENRAAESESPFAGKSWWIVALLVLFGGLCMNLTPCVLPMVPINLMVIGRSALRGALYGLGIALAYGAMGLLAALGGMAFGEIQGNPWFNAAIAVLFLFLSLALFGFFFIDFSKNRGSLSSLRTSMWPGLFAFFMGVVSAVLAGACVAPILIAVLLLTADLVGKGAYLALALPFVLGLGMALPWPFAGAGMQVLPKPGAWMKGVNRAFGVLVLLFAVWYGRLAYLGWTRGGDASHEGIPGAAAATPETFASAFAAAKEKGKPVFVDCWATWCKNCSAMERTTFADPRVRAALANYAIIRLQAEDMKELRRLESFKDVKGLPAFAVFGEKAE
ncbi:MAG: thioredoxin family protein [Kiritimatiellae bacterium]|nr:thioredoxin family protein [Kiritimatiellia bacterium]